MPGNVQASAQELERTAIEALDAIKSNPISKRGASRTSVEEVRSPPDCATSVHCRQKTDAKPAQFSIGSNPS